MLSLLFTLFVVVGQVPASGAIDVSKVTVGTPTVVIEFDLGKLKGEFRQLAWSPEGTQIYLQAAEPKSGGAEKLYHYVVNVAGGRLTTVPQQPDWAAQYWAFKSDRSAPGITTLMIDVEQKFETMKFGTGSAGAAEGGDRLGGGTVMSSNNIEREAQSQKQHVVRFKLLDETVSEFVNERPMPGLMFSWGPAGSGTIAYTDRDGRLMLLDQQKHKQTVNGAKDALLPAWTTDAARLAWVQRTGRKKYALVWAPVAR